jgi:hypothetical protein
MQCEKGDITDDRNRKKTATSGEHFTQPKGVLAGNRFLTDDRHFPAQNRPNRAAPDEMTHQHCTRAAYRAKLSSASWWLFYR